jgi:hypothetical protein
MRGRVWCGGSCWGELTREGAGFLAEIAELAEKGTLKEKSGLGGRQTKAGMVWRVMLRR